LQALKVKKVKNRLKVRKRAENRGFYGFTVFNSLVPVVGLEPTQIRMNTGFFDSVSKTLVN
jgi:hypothetical protein